MRKKLEFWAVLVIVAGLGFMCLGFGGIIYTYGNAAREQITTPDDASIPGVPVRGPLTLKAQADIIREHTLTSTGGLTYAQMPGRIPQLDAKGNPVLDADGKPVEVSNPARTIWITATTLNTALNLGIMAYGISVLVMALGAMFVLFGFLFFCLAQDRK